MVVVAIVVVVVLVVVVVVGVSVVSASSAATVDASVCNSVVEGASMASARVVSANSCRLVDSSSPLVLVRFSCCSDTCAAERVLWLCTSVAF